MNIYGILVSLTRSPTFKVIVYGEFQQEPLSVLPCSLILIGRAVTLGGCNKSGAQVRILSIPKYRGMVAQWQSTEISMAETVDNSLETGSNLKLLYIAGGGTGYVSPSFF